MRSAADLDGAGRRAVLDHLVGLGFQGRRRRTQSYPGRPHSMDGNDQLRKIEALLAEAKRPWDYAAGILKRMYGEDAPARLAWATPEQLRAVIVALIKDAERHGRRTA